MRLREFLLHNARQFGTLFGLLGLVLVLWILTPYFLTVSNLLNVMQQTSINAIIAVGMTFVIITAGIDLSVGSIVAFSGVHFQLRSYPSHRGTGRLNLSVFPRQ